MPEVPDASPPDAPPPDAWVPQVASSCMTCHNGSDKEDYTGGQLTNPHPFGTVGPTSAHISCVTCHGGDPNGTGRVNSHVPPPPLFGTPQDPMQYIRPDGAGVFDFAAEFCRRTLVCLDKIPDYEIDGKMYSGLDYLQFLNPGDLRVTSQGSGCGACHGLHSQWVSQSPIATASGFFSGTRYAIGVDNDIPNHQNWYSDTAADYGFRAVTDDDFSYDGSIIGPVGELRELPEKAGYDTGVIRDNPAYQNAATLTDYWVAASNGDDYINQVFDDSPLETLVMEQVGITCGDCHLGSAGANNRYADFRSSGCTSCHMQYSPDGRSRSSDPNVARNVPLNPDQIAPGERAHIATHEIRNVYKPRVGGGFVSGISDMACAGCHQGSNRTVLQFWGVRLDQNKDLTNLVQYPANPGDFDDAQDDERFFTGQNTTFNGRDFQQLIVEEDYDNDGRDDTPADVHYEAGMGCIDCHGGRDLHGGSTNAAATDPLNGKMVSRMDQAVGIQCESCHGNIDDRAATAKCVDDAGTAGSDCAVDRWGTPLTNVTRTADGNYILRGRLDGKEHYIPQTYDVVNNNNVTLPGRGDVYSPKAAYAMGRADNNLGTPAGPDQANLQVTTGFTHTENLDCAACHSSWTNNCIGCHLRTEYDDEDPTLFSNITGERIVLDQLNADFTYITPVPFQLAVNARGKVTQTQPNTKMFYAYQDPGGNLSDVFAFNDRNGNGNNPDVGGRGTFPAMSHNAILAHSIRGKVDGANEGPRYCVACHLTQEGLTQFGAQYAAFRTALANNNYDDNPLNGLDYALLQQHIGQNPGNQLNSPIWVHMVAGLGSGLFAFDANGCPVNPLDTDNNRKICDNGAPADNFDPNNIVYDIDRLSQVDNNGVPTGVSNASGKHPLHSGQSSLLRDGAQDPYMAGPLGRTLAGRLANPDDPQVILIDTYYDADGQPVGQAPQ
ncbi:hypothetical protein [Haliangium sp.]|uniref:hypothetical protein n=1 Tax=Haliangium sp. TaxID=2663208 RepID=UPI003D0BFBBB